MLEKHILDEIVPLVSGEQGTSEHILISAGGNDDIGQPDCDGIIRHGDRNGETSVVIAGCCIGCSLFYPT